MLPQMARVSAGLITALLAAISVKFAVFDLVLARAPAGTPVMALFWTSVQSVIAYGFFPAVVVVTATEFLRIRHLALHIALGATVTVLAALIASHGEVLTSPAFSNGTLTGFCLLSTAILSSLAYWAIAGRYAGWRGESIEQAEALAAEAFQAASANAHAEKCTQCVVLRSALGVGVFVLMASISLWISDLSAWFQAEAQSQGNAVLKNAGYTWAKFKVDGDRGVIEGAAPDEFQRLAALNSVRDALNSVTGFPGILSRIDNQATARSAASIAAQNIEAVRRETEEKASKEAVRMVAEAAHAAEAEARRKFEQEAQAARQLEAEARARAEADAMSGKETAAGVAGGEAGDAKQAATAAAIPVKTGTDAGDSSQVAAIAEPGSPDDSVAPSAEDVGAAVDPSSAGACTSQDLAMIESTKIPFDSQRFDMMNGVNTELDRLAASAQACPQQFIVVNGYADPYQDSLFNRSLGLQRAESVRDELIARGVPATRVSAKASTSGGQFVGALNEDMRSQNRRTEFKLASASEMSRDANLGPDERATKCESDLSDIMAQSIIHFPSGSSNISAESMGLIKKLARSIRTCGSVIVTVEGHTDKTGDPNYNQFLSEQRATAVREALVGAGADTTRLASRGFASSQPYDPGNNSQAYALNRRIEFKVSGKFTSSSTGGP